MVGGRGGMVGGILGVCLYVKGDDWRIRGKREKWFKVKKDGWRQKE